MSTASEGSAGDPVATITVHRGNPTAEEVAALTVLAAALVSGDEPVQKSGRTGWTSASRRLAQFSRGSGWGRR